MRRSQIEVDRQSLTGLRCSGKEESRVKSQGIPGQGARQVSHEEEWHPTGGSLAGSPTTSNQRLLQTMAGAKARWSPPPKQSPCRKLGQPGVKPQHPSGISPTLPSSGSTWSGQPGNSYLHSEAEEPGKRTIQVDGSQAGQGRSWTGKSSPNLLPELQGDSWGSEQVFGSYQTKSSSILVLA